MHEQGVDIVIAPLPVEDACRGSDKLVPGRLARLIARLFACRYAGEFPGLVVEGR